MGGAIAAMKEAVIVKVVDGVVTLAEYRVTGAAEVARKTRHQ